MEHNYFHYPYLRQTDNVTEQGGWMGEEWACESEGGETEGCGGRKVSARRLGSALGREHLYA